MKQPSGASGEPSSARTGARSDRWFLVTTSISAASPSSAVVRTSRFSPTSWFWFWFCPWRHAGSRAQSGRGASGCESQFTVGPEMRSEIGSRAVILPGVIIGREAMVRSLQPSPVKNEGWAVAVMAISTVLTGLLSLAQVKLRIRAARMGGRTAQEVLECGDGFGVQAIRLKALAQVEKRICGLGITWGATEESREGGAGCGMVAVVRLPVPKPMKKP